MKRGVGLLCLGSALVLATGCADRHRGTTVDGLLEISEAELNFDRVALHSSKELELTLTNLGRAPLNLQELVIEGPAGSYRTELSAEAPHQLATAASAKVKVTFIPQVDGALNGDLVIVTDARQTPRAKVPLIGRGVDAEARLTAGDFDFGRIEVDSVKTLTFSAQNPSELPVEVAPRILGSDQDEFATDRVVLSPGEKRDFAFTFAPSRVGRKIVSLSVSTCRGCSDALYNVSAEALDRAIVAVPAEVDLGQVPIDRTVDGKLKLQNISTEPMQIIEMSMANTDPSFTVSTAGFPLIINGGQTREWSVKYSPGHMGIAEGEAVFKVRSKRNPTTSVAVRAFGGSPELCISPLNFDYGKVPVGAKIPQLVTIKNCGSANGAPLTITSLVFGGSGPKLPGEEQFHLADTPLPRTLIANEQMTVKAYFEPTRPGTANATLNVRSTAFAAAHLKVGFVGTAETHAPCNVSVTPRALDFGNAAPGRGVVLGFRIENRGFDVCAMKNVRIGNDGGGAFRLPAGDYDGQVVPPGGFFTVQVTFTPPSSGGDFAGTALVNQADPARPVITVPLVGHSSATCLTAAPPFLDFGVTRPECPVRPRRTSLVNSCTQPITLSSATIGHGTMDGEFVLDAPPKPLPLVMNPGDAMSLTVNYSGSVRGVNLAPLYLQLANEPYPMLVSLVGESTAKTDQQDRFVQQDGSKVDVLFVVDNTASMVEEQPRLIDAVPTFVQEALSRKVDLHLAVTTTGIETASAACPGGAQGGEAGRFVPVDGSRPRMMTHATANLAAALQENVRVGQCAFVEKGLEAVRRALSTPLVDGDDDPRTAQPNDGNKGFLRDEAALAVVFIGDEDDHSPDDVETYVKFLQSKKGSGQPGRATVYAIAPTNAVCETAGGTGTRYDQAAARTGGTVLNICETDYRPLMTALAGKAFGPQDRFPLSAQPEVPTLNVLVNGVPVNGTWTYDGSSNSIVFSTRPPAGARIQVDYRRVCPQ